MQSQKILNIVFLILCSFLLSVSCVKNEKYDPYKNLSRQLEENEREFQEQLNKSRQEGYARAEKLRMPVNSWKTSTRI